MSTSKPAGIKVRALHASSEAALRRDRTALEDLQVLLRAHRADMHELADLLAAMPGGAPQALWDWAAAHGDNFVRGLMGTMDALNQDQQTLLDGLIRPVEESVVLDKTRQSERAKESRTEVTREDVVWALDTYANRKGDNLLIKGWEKRVRNFLYHVLKDRIGERPLDMTMAQYVKALNPGWRTVKERIPLPEIKRYLAAWEERGRAPDPGPDAADTK